MKKLLLILGILLTAVVLQNCQKENKLCPDDWQEAAIIGQDFRRCFCCGGWFIDLGQDTVRAFTLPQSFEIDQDSNFPVTVCLTYEALLGPCENFGSLVTVDQIKRR